MSSERGRFYVAVDKAVADLKLPQDVQEELWSLLHAGVSAWVRHRYQAASLNEAHRKATTDD